MTNRPLEVIERLGAEFALLHDQKIRKIDTSPRLGRTRAQESYLSQMLVHTVIECNGFARLI